MQTAGIAFLAYQNLLLNDPLAKKDVSFLRNCPKCHNQVKVKVEGQSVELCLPGAESESDQLAVDVHTLQPDEEIVSENENLTDDFMQEESDVSGEDLMAPNSSSDDEIPRRVTNELTITQYDELEQMSPELLTQSVFTFPSQVAGASANLNPDNFAVDDDDDDDSL